MFIDFDYIFKEGDEVNNIYFLSQDFCFYVLPKYQNAKYIRIKTGNHFGFCDILSNMISKQDINQDNWISRKNLILHQFTITSG